MQIMHLTSDDSNTDSPAAHTIENATTAVIEREESHGENAIFGDLEALDRKDSSSLSNPGVTDLFTHHIRTSDEIPVRAKPYPVPYSLRVHLNVDLHHEVQEMLDTGIIRESRSPNASPVVVHHYCAAFCTIHPGHPPKALLLHHLTHTSDLLKQSPFHTVDPQTIGLPQARSPLKQSSIITFSNWLVHHPWEEVLMTHDVETKWKHYVASITSTYHHFFPEKKLRKHPADLPWITDSQKINESKRSCSSHRLDTTQFPAYLPTRTTVPVVEEHQVCQKIQRTKAKRSITTIDIPMPLLKQRPSDWKTSYVTAVPKTPSPDILDETRPVPITPMPSFLCESFVSKWAYADLHPSFDKQHKAFDLVDHTTVRKASVVGLHVSWRGSRTFSRSAAWQSACRVPRLPFCLIHVGCPGAPTKILGITHSWDQHVSTIVTSASFRLYMLRHLKTLGVPPSELITIYKTFILPRLTYASPDWSFSLDAAQLLRLEKVQKRAMKIILGSSYNCYEDALTTLGLTTLSALYQKMLLQFGEKTLNNPRHRHLPAPALPPRHTQQAVPEGLGRTDMRIALCQIWLLRLSLCLYFISSLCTFSPLIWSLSSLSSININPPQYLSQPILLSYPLPASPLSRTSLHSPSSLSSLISPLLPSFHLQRSSLPSRYYVSYTCSHCLPRIYPFI
ncbi:hypothetical protein C7M84_000199 [Penaeus vannamei]|uniref:RNA-directed DNA polymerase from mobile element jockey n=1 Tax=Penaeus vannamei TaxID=6689 RepID=A0A3R7QJS4_PENVA|nr:hypothetical protein C7M84_000199 [Penaeus vannamei]